MPIAFVAERIFTGEEFLPNHAVIVEEGRISEVIPAGNISSDTQTIQLEGTLAPAFIDLQIYGAHGRLFAVYPDTESLHKLTDYCRQGGAANCMVTLASNEYDVFHKGIDAVRNFWQSGGTGILGLHLEGPWINVAKRGAHVESLIHSPTIEQVKELLDYGKDVIKMITLAPEVCSKEVVQLILSRGIIISAGHSNATYSEAIAGFENGITTVTHLYNAMSPLHHREPGLVGATLNHHSVAASIIPDGHHVDFAAISIAKKLMNDRLFVITDAVTETDSGYYPHKLAGDKYESEGILSGSALTMGKAYLNLIKHAGIEDSEALRMCSLYPARVIRMQDEIGAIKKGCRAEMVSIVNDEISLVNLSTSGK